MRYFINKTLLLATFLSCFVAVSYAQLSKDSVLIGDQVLWSKDFKLNKLADYEAIPYSTILSQDTLVGGAVEVVKDLQIEELSIKDEISTLRAKMLLTSFDSGSYVLPSPVIIYRLSDGSIDTLLLGKTTLYVNNLGIDTTYFTPYDIKAQEKYPFSFKVLIPWIIGLLLLALIVFGVWRYLKYRRDLKAGKYAEPPHIVALKKLEKLRKDRAWQGGREKVYYSGITDTLKEYIEKRYNIGAVEMTSAEIMEALDNKKIEHKLFSELKGMLSLADLVKFAKHTPTITENENAMHVAVNFVNFAYMSELEEEKVDFYVEEKLKEEDFESTEEAILNYKKEDK